MASLADAILTEHAAEQLEERQISPAELRQILRMPETVTEVRRGRIVAQGMLIREQSPRPFLLRVVVDVDREPCEIVTAYLTSKLAKYRSRP